MEQLNLVDSDKKSIKRDIIKVLRAQGYVVKHGLMEFSHVLTKDDIRRMNEIAVAYKIKMAESSLRRYEEDLLKYIADGSELNIERIKPKLVPVYAGTKEEILFRYASLHWSIPVSSGYGRRLRFLVMDEGNNKLIGLFGLCDPVYALKKRDTFIGWSLEAKKERLYHVMDAYILGAVPPYSRLLCGKLIALLALSNEVRHIFQQKYADTRTFISRKIRQPWLVLITTTSALGRTSIYNRIKLEGYEFWKSMGFTQGSGEFHFSNGVYEKIKEFAESHCHPTAKQLDWGKGFRNKREVIKKCLPLVGLSTKLLYHGIKREIFIAPLAQNGIQFLRGSESRPDFFDWPADELAQKFIERWLIPRAKRVTDYISFHHESFRVWVNT